MSTAYGALPSSTGAIFGLTAKRAWAQRLRFYLPFSHEEEVLEIGTLRAFQSGKGGLNPAESNGLNAGI